MQERTLFIEALEIAQLAERTAFLDRACGDDEALRARVEELLEAHEAPGSFMERPAAELDGSTQLAGFSNGKVLPPVATFLSGYEILEELGRGGMGVVYKARQTRLKRLVALKMLLAGPHASADQRARFRTEAEAVAHLQHPNIVQIYEVGDAGDCPFLALEFIGGGSLKGCLSGTPQPAQPAAQFMETLARAIHYAHEHGVVHRDLKPGNILLQIADFGLQIAEAKTNDSRQSAICDLQSAIPKIADFGLAKQFEAEALTAAELTASGAILGSPCYMAPEQAAGKPGTISPAADIYALGAILYELLSGRPPFQGETTLDTLQQVRSQEPVPPSRLVPRLPRDLETICLKCLEKEPGRRYANALVLADDLRRFRDREPILARPVGPLERSWRWSRRNPGWALMLGTLATLVLVILMGSWLGMAHLQEALATSEGNLDRALAAERDAQKQYVAALLEQAHATHRGRRSGQRFETLRLVEEANRRRRALGLAPGRELADLASAALAMPDLYPAVKWPGFPAGSTYVAFDDSLSIYARSDATGNCTVCRLEDGKEVVLHRLAGLGTPAAVYSPRLSGDGRFVAVLYQNNRMQLWRIDGPRPEVWLEIPAMAATYHVGPFLDFAADSRHAVFAHLDGRITHCDLVRRQQVTFPATVLAREVKLAVHPSEPLVAVSSYFSPVVQVRDWRSGAVRHAWEHPNGINSCAWHPDGRTLATAATDGVIRLIELPRRRVTRHFGPVAAGGARLRFNHRGDRLLVADDWGGGGVHLWDAVAGRELFAMAHLMFSVNMRFSRDDRFVAGGLDGNHLVTWGVGDGRECRTLTRYMMPANGYYSYVAVHPDGRLLAVVTRDGVGFWDLVTGQELRLVTTDRPRHLIFEPGAEGGLLIVGWNGVLRCAIKRQEKGSETSAPRYEIGRPRHLNNILANGITLSADGGTMALASRIVFPRPGVWLGQAAKPEQLRRLDPGQDIAFARLSPDGRWLVTNTHETGVCKIWDARSGKFIKSLPGKSWGVRFSPDGRWLATNIRLWRVGSTIADWSAGPELGDHNGLFAFSPDSKLLALPTRKGHIRLFDPETAHDVADLEDPELDTGFVTFTPDGIRLIITGKGIHIWDLERIATELAVRDLAAPGSRVDGSPVKSEIRISKSETNSNIEIRNAALADACFRAGKALRQHGWHEAAHWCLSQAIRLAPSQSEAELALAEEHVRERHWAEALAALDRAAEIPDLRGKAVFYRSLAYLHLGQHGKAEDDRRLLRDAHPDFVDACKRMGNLHARRGDQALAMVFFQAALHFSPDDYRLADQVARFLATGPERFRDLPAALPLARRAVKLDPNNPSCWNTLGACCYRMGGWQEAVAAVENGLKLGAAEPDAFGLYLLSLCHQRLGQPQTARAFLDRARHWHLQHGSRLPRWLAEDLKRLRVEAEQAALSLRN